VSRALKIQKACSVLSIFGLTLLLLLSPCKVRNYIQGELGIPITQVLNKSQSVKQGFDCEEFNASKAHQHQSKQTSYPLGVTFPKAYYLSPIVQVQKHSLPNTSKSSLRPDVPLYILYQTFLVYS